MTTTTNRRRGLLATALLCILAAGCGQGSQPQPDAAPAPADDTSAATDDKRSFIGRKAAEGIAKAAEALRTENIALGKDTHIVINGRGYGSGSSDKDLPRAEITPEGVLLIEDKPVEADPRQQALLLGHRRELEELALAAMAIGAQGADIAGTALSGLGEAMFGGEEGRQAFEARLEAESGKIKDEAMRLCALLPGLYDSQQALAAAMPAFVPYATMTPQDVENCDDEVRDGLRDATGNGSHAAIDAGRGGAGGQ